MFFSPYLSTLQSEFSGFYSLKMLFLIIFSLRRYVWRALSGMKRTRFGHVFSTCIHLKVFGIMKPPSPGMFDFRRQILQNVLNVRNILINVLMVQTTLLSNLPETQHLKNYIILPNVIWKRSKENIFLSFKTKIKFPYIKQRLETMNKISLK